MPKLTTMSRIRSWRAIFILTLACCASGIGTNNRAAAAPAQLTAQQQAKFQKEVKANAQREIRAEEQRNIGEALPANVTAFNDQGKTVRLRDVLHGPAIVVKTEAGCPPCERMIAYLRTHGPDFARRHHVQIVVWNTAAPPHLQDLAGGDPTGEKYPRNMPPPILVLHVKDFGAKGFLGGTWFPTIFFFDKDRKLVARRVPSKGEPADWLRPSSPHDSGR